MTEINPQTPIPQEFENWVHEWLRANVVTQASENEDIDITLDRHNAKTTWARSIAYAVFRHLSPSAAPAAGTFFFSQDESCHWYMIPTERREEWSKARDLDLETDEGYEEWQKGNWEDYMTGGGIGDIDFIPSPPTPGA